MTNILDSKLLYLDEHLTCSHYMKKINSGFYISACKKGTKETGKDHSLKNHILFVLEGKLRIKCNQYSSKFLNAQEIVFIAKGSVFNLEYFEDSIVLVASFNELSINCNKLSLEALSPYTECLSYDLEVLPFKKPMVVFINLLSIYLQNGANCVHLHELKMNELFLCFRYFYTKEELAALFYPIIGRSFDFRQLLIENAHKVKNIQEIILLSKMSKTVFYEKFREEFGTITPKNWLNEKFADKLLYTASQSGITVKELAVLMNFDSVPSLQQYCKRHFKCTPSELIKRNQSDL